MKNIVLNYILLCIFIGTVAYAKNSNSQTSLDKVEQDIRQLLIDIQTHVKKKYGSKLTDEIAIRLETEPIILSEITKVPLTAIEDNDGTWEEIYMVNGKKCLSIGLGYTDIYINKGADSKSEICQKTYIIPVIARYLNEYTNIFDMQIDENDGQNNQSSEYASNKNSNNDTMNSSEKLAIARAQTDIENIIYDVDKYAEEHAKTWDPFKDPDYYIDVRKSTNIPLKEVKTKFDAIGYAYMVYGKECVVIFASYNRGIKGVFKNIWVEKGSNEFDKICQEVYAVPAITKLLDDQYIISEELYDEYTDDEMSEKNKKLADDYVNSQNEKVEQVQNTAKIEAPKVYMESKIKESDWTTFDILTIQATDNNTIINEIIVNRGNCKVGDKFPIKPLKFGERKSYVFARSDLEVLAFAFTDYKGILCNKDDVLEVVLKTNGGDFKYEFKKY